MQRSPSAEGAGAPCRGGESRCKAAVCCYPVLLPISTFCCCIHACFSFISRTELALAGPAGLGRKLGGLCGTGAGAAGLAGAVRGLCRGYGGQPVGSQLVAPLHDCAGLSAVAGG